MRLARPLLLAAVGLVVTGIVAAVSTGAGGAAWTSVVSALPDGLLPQRAVPQGPWGERPAPSPGAVRTPEGYVLPVIADLGDGRYRVLSPCANEVEVLGEPVGPVHVVVDPGHGGGEPGAVGPGGTREADVNLVIAHRLVEELAAQGAVAVLTRDRDVRVTIQTRAALAVALQPVAFVSVHHNSAADRAIGHPGTEVYHQATDPASRRLAGLVYEEIVTAFGPLLPEWSATSRAGVSFRLLDDGSDLYGVLRRSAGVPAVLVEGAFINDPDEEALLVRDDVQRAEARAIARALQRFVGTDQPGSGFLEVANPYAGGGGSGGGTAGCVDPVL